MAATRSEAQQLIEAGAVSLKGSPATRAASLVAPEEAIVVSDEHPRFVSRGGLKLDGALRDLDIPVAGRRWLDAGASTGGFTDRLLKGGATGVIAVDVGYGQLDWSLRQDPRVAVMERTNARYLSGEDLPFAPGLLVADLSFISLVVALSNLLSTTPSIREAIVLVKPQFEAGPEQVGRGGLVRDVAVRAAVVRKVAGAFEALGFGAVDVTRSPVAGRRAGNVEYPLRLLRGVEATLDEGRILAVVGEEV